MAGAPPLSSLDKPEDYKELLKQDRGDDCLACRVIGRSSHQATVFWKVEYPVVLTPFSWCSGGGAFLGLAAYSYISGHAELERNKALILKKNPMIGMRGRRAGITGIALGLAYLGVWRLFR